VNNCVAHFSPLACVFSLLTAYTKPRLLTIIKLRSYLRPFSCLIPSLNVPSHIHSSDPLSEQKLAKGDVVKLHLGAHIDGFAAISAETIVIGATPNSPVTGRRADVLRAAWTAAEVAMRLVRVGNKNWQVTEAVSKVAAAWDCKPVEGAFSLVTGSKLVWN
jgi:methionine aminopeptidase